MPDHDQGNPIYQDAIRYDAEHWWKTDDLVFWEKMARRFGPKVLELAAGTGRIAPVILGTGANYTGVDTSGPFLARANDKLAGWASSVKLLQADIRDYALGETFGLIFIGFNSFLHMLTDEDAAKALARARAHCGPQGRLIIDIFVPDPGFLYRPANRRYPTMDYIDPETKQSVTVEETSNFDPDAELNHITWYYSTDDQKDFLVYEFTMRMFYPDTMHRLLAEAGFRIESKWGGYDEKPLGPDSPIQIYVAVPEEG